MGGPGAQEMRVTVGRSEETKRGPTGCPNAPSSHVMQLCIRNVDARALNQSRRHAQHAAQPHPHLIYTNPTDAPPQLHPHLICTKPTNALTTSAHSSSQRNTRKKWRLPLPTTLPTCRAKG